MDPVEIMVHFVEIAQETQYDLCTFIYMYYRLFKKETNF